MERLFAVVVKGESWAETDGGDGSRGGEGRCCCCGGGAEIRRRLRGGGLTSGDGIVSVLSTSCQGKLRLQLQQWEFFVSWHYIR